MDDIILSEALPAAEFKIFTGVLKAFEGADGKKRLHGVASSTTKDLHGDVMEESALRDMERAANDNLTIFLNHSYNVPEDVAGSVEKAMVRQRGADGDGNPNWDLDYEIVVEDDNPRALKAWNSIQKGTKLGLSIGAMIPVGGATRDKKSGALTISHINLLETSIVSIPANPRSWISNAVKALRSVEKSQTIGLGAPELELDGDTYTIRGSLNGLRVSDGTFSSGSGILVGEQGPETFVPVTDGTIIEAACPSCGGGKGAPKGDCGNAFHGKEADVEPDVTDAKVRIIEVDTDSPSGGSADGSSSQEDSRESDPDTETLSVTPVAEGAEDDAAVALAAAAELQDSLDPVVRSAIETMSALLETSTAKLVESREELAAEKQLRLEAEADRDEAVKAAAEVIRQAYALIDKLADTPIGRKTRYVETRKSLDHLSAIYDEPVRKLLTQGVPSDGR